MTLNYDAVVVQGIVIVMLPRLLLWDMYCSACLWGNTN